MSFKLFTLQALGKIKATEKIEAERAALYADYQEFLAVGASEDLKKYLELESWVNSDEFKKRKAEIESLQFKGSHEQKDLLEYQKLAKSKKIKLFLQTNSSNELKKFGSIKGSEKLDEYYQLKDYMDNGEFRKEKREIESQVYKGSAEQNHEKELTALKKNKGIKAYFKLHESADLKEYQDFSDSEKLKRFFDLKNTAERDKEGKKKYRELRRDAQIKKYFRFERSTQLRLYWETKGSHQLERYFELEKVIGSKEFKEKKAYLLDKKKFEKSEAFSKLQHFNNLKKDGDIVFFLKFEKSKNYINYLDLKDSFELKRYYELKEKTESKEFLERKAYLEDKKKWEKSDEYKRQQSFLGMKALPEFVKYFKYKGTDSFDFFKEWEISFEDTFEGRSLDSKKWITAGYWANKLVGDNFSQPGDLQCFNSGKNISLNNRLSLQVKKEKATGKVWNAAAGFEPTEFEYTSDTINTGESFWMEEGIVEAKIKFSPTKEVVNFFYLLGGKASPQLNLLEMGAKNRMGALSLEDGKAVFEGTSIGNLKAGKYYLFAMELAKGKITWKINDVVIYEMQASEYGFPMHLNIATIVVNNIPASKLPANFEVEWVRCYKKSS